MLRHHPDRARKSLTADAPRAGCSENAKWPAPSMMTSRAVGIAAAISTPISRGISLSSAPWMTVVGQEIEESSPRESMRSVVAACWRRKASGPTPAAMARHGPQQSWV